MTTTHREGGEPVCMMKATAWAQRLLDGRANAS